VIDQLLHHDLRETASASADDDGFHVSDITGRCRSPGGGTPQSGSARARDADAIAGRQARYVAAPSSTEEASTLLQGAAALGLTVVPRGAGRLQHWETRPATAHPHPERIRASLFPFTLPCGGEPMPRG
jgi:hypothetical protein